VSKVAQLQTLECSSAAVRPVRGNWNVPNFGTACSVSNPVYTDTGIPVFGTPNTDTDSGKNVPGKGIFREKTSTPANTGIDIFEIPVLYRPRY
jgi:hypothetical protein